MAPRPLAALPSRPDKKASKQDRRRREIMDAAAEVFATKGYHAATTRDIADRLGMQAGSLYYYVASKEAALEEVCRIGGADFDANLAAIRAGGLPAPAMIRAAIASHLQGVHRHYVTCFAHNRRFLPAHLLPEMNDLAKRYLAQWEAIFRRGIAAGELSPGTDPRLAALAVVSLCNGAVAHIEHRPAAEADAMVDGITRLFLQGVERHAAAGTAAGGPAA